MSNKKKHVWSTIKRMGREYGHVAFGIDQISKESGVPEAELYEHDNFTGILTDLSDDGKIVLDRFGGEVLVEIDDSLEDE